MASNTAAMPPLTGQATRNTIMRPSPVRKIHKPKLRARILQGKKAKNRVDTGALEIECEDFVRYLHSAPFCVAVNNTSRPKTCRCLGDIDLELYTEPIALYMYRYALMKWDAQIKIVIEWLKYASVIQRHPGFNQGEKAICFLIPGTNQSCCADTVCRLLGIGKDRWTRALKLAKSGRMPIHAHTATQSNNANRKVNSNLMYFFEDMTKLGCPRATLFVRDIVGDRIHHSMRQTQEDLIELPTAMSKRSIYGRFLREKGWKYKVSTVNGVAHKEPLEGVTQDKDVGSWWKFLDYWKRNYPHLVVAAPREDICGECYLYFNQHKHQSRKKPGLDLEDLFGDSDGDDEDEVEEPEELPPEEPVAEAFIGPEQFPYLLANRLA